MFHNSVGSRVPALVPFVVLALACIACDDSRATSAKDADASVEQPRDDTKAADSGAQTAGRGGSSVAADSGDGASEKASRDSASGDDAQASSASYALCDGFDDIRLAYQSGGGHVEDSYYFLNTYGVEFLYVGRARRQAVPTTAAA